MGEPQSWALRAVQRLRWSTVSEGSAGVCHCGKIVVVSGARAKISFVSGLSLPCWTRVSVR